MSTIRGNGRFRTGWDVFVFVLILVSCVAVPYQIAFVREIRLPGSILLYLIDLVFLFDICLNFRISRRRSDWRSCCT